MRIVTFCLALLLFSFQRGLALDADRKMIAENSWAQVLVEKKLYKLPNNKHFFVHVCLSNKSEKTIGFELSKKYSLFYINQWCASREPQRMIIDERRMNQPTISTQQKQYLIDVFNNKIASSTELTRLIKVKPGKVFDYYIAFNNGDYAAVEKDSERYIIIVMDGHMLLTDGKTINIIERDNDTNAMAEVAIASKFISWGLIPASAQVFGN